MNVETGAQLDYGTGLNKLQWSHVLMNVETFHLSVVRERPFHSFNGATSS